MQGQLIKIYSNHNNLRTPTVSGQFSALPTTSERFEMTAESLSGEGFRYVWTSPIEQTWQVEIDSRVAVMFKTENSLYGLICD